MFDRRVNVLANPRSGSATAFRSLAWITVLALADFDGSEKAMSPGLTTSFRLKNTYVS
jgi:hypothetical protein